ncbi:MAG: hypothetical protein L3K03_00185 [Thermoplasmata archaeon]|nr:hypothetical protein [Thermoplasmata archaeon]
MIVVSPALEEAIGLELLILFLVARRAYQMYMGVTYSAPRLYLVMVLYGFLLALTLGETYALFPWYATAADVAIVVATAWLFTAHAASTVVFETGPTGVRKYRLPISLVLVYIVLFAVRLAIEVVYFPSLITDGTAPAAGTISTVAFVALATVDALFAFSTGLLFGRGLGVVRAHDRLPAIPPPPTAPSWSQ